VENSPSADLFSHNLRVPLFFKDLRFSSSSSSSKQSATMAKSQVLKFVNIMRTFRDIV
jgi:hypothetical protein